MLYMVLVVIEMEQVEMEQVDSRLEHQGSLTFSCTQPPRLRRASESDFPLLPRALLSVPPLSWRQRRLELERHWRCT